MNKLTTTMAATAALGGLLLGSPAAFAYRGSEYEYARVVSAEPVMRQVRVSEPSDECRDEPVRERTVYGGHPDPGAVLIGGIIGGIIGHQFGGGHGRDAATAAGAVIGAHAGATHTWQDERVVDRDVVQTTCHTAYRTRYVEEAAGYDVTYRFHGRLYHTHTPYDPGDRIRVRVQVAPVDDEDGLD